MTIREYLESIGATPAEMSAKVVSRMEQRMLTDGDFKDMQFDTVADTLRRLISDAMRIDGKTTESINDLKRVKSNLDETMQRARDIDIDLAKTVSDANKISITDKTIKDAVIAYRTILEITQNVFGENMMTADVIVSAINAASYIGWRSIMGPKDASNCDNGFMQVERIKSRR